MTAVYDLKDDPTLPYEVRGNSLHESDIDANDTDFMKSMNFAKWCLRLTLCYVRARRRLHGVCAWALQVSEMKESTSSTSRVCRSYALRLLSTLR